jgi:hypothetical protein
VKVSAEVEIPGRDEGGEHAAGRRPPAGRRAPGLASRRPDDGARDGAAFGAGAGLGSAVLVDLWCPVSYVPHLLLGHVLPIAVLAAAGACLGARILGALRR